MGRTSQFLSRLGDVPPLCIITKQPQVYENIGTLETRKELESWITEGELSGDVLCSILITASVPNISLTRGVIQDCHSLDTLYTLLSSAKRYQLNPQASSVSSFYLV